MIVQKPLVSVLMPCYNRENYIIESLESILTQTYTNFEFIIIDNCSIDNTFKIVEEYAKEEYSQKKFIEGKSAVPVSGRVFDADDIATLVDSALDFHLTTYRYNDEFEKGLKEFFGLKYALSCNSGS